MRSIFSPRGMILIWVVLTASIGLGAQLRQLALEIRAARPETLVSQLFDGINSIPPKAIDAFFNAVHFEPAAVIFSLSIVQIQSIHLIFLLGALALGVVVLLYQKAIRSTAFADDFVMLLVSYLASQIVVGIWVRADASIRPIQPGLLCFLMILTIVMLTWRGGGKDDTRVFWRGVFEIYLISLFFFPGPIIDSTATALEGLAAFGEALHSSSGFVLWCGVGMIIALWLLYGLGSKPKKPSGEVIEGLKKKIDEELDKAKKQA